MKTELQAILGPGNEVLTNIKNHGAVLMTGVGDFDAEMWAEFEAKFDALRVQPARGGGPVRLPPDFVTFADAWFDPILDHPSRLGATFFHLDLEGECIVQRAMPFDEGVELMREHLPRGIMRLEGSEHFVSATMAPQLQVRFNLASRGLFRQ